MAHFTVNTGELMALANRLSALASELAEAGTVRGERSGIFGSGAIDGGMGSFVGHWSEGLGEIHTHIDGLAQRLMYAGEGYQRNESAIAASTQAGISR
jgi:hypothetical protein